MSVTVSQHAIPFSAAPGQEIFAIGDIHGHTELLSALFDTISGTPRAPASERIVFLLGDLIDRGPDSLGCLDLAVKAKELTGADAVEGLFGNHEQMLLTAIIADHQIGRRNSAFGLWMMNGGLCVVNDLLDQGHSVKTPSDLRQALGEERIKWLEGLSKYRTSGEIMFVHAGLNPNCHLDRFLSEPFDVQFEEMRGDNHWAWVREPFLQHRPSDHDTRGHHGYFVVHGHTPPNHDPACLDQQLANDRVNLDGGSFGTGRARMVRVIGSSLTIYEAG